MENKGLMDCLLTQEERNQVYETFGGEWGTTGDERKAYCKAQLNSPKLQAYIDNKVAEAIKALRQYHNGFISGERCAELTGMNTYEFFELLKEVEDNEKGRTKEKSSIELPSKNR